MYGPAHSMDIVDVFSVAGCSILAGGLAGAAFANQKKQDSPKYLRILPFVFSIAVLGGVGQLSSWNIEHTAFSGMFYLSGVIVGILICYWWLPRLYLQVPEELSEHEKDNVRKLIRANLFEVGHSATEEAVRSKIDDLLRARKAANKDAMVALHDLIHKTRDECIDLLRKQKQIDEQESQPPGTDKEEQRAELTRSFMINYLQRVVKLFGCITDSNKLWGAVRVLDVNAEGISVYRTLARYSQEGNIDTRSGKSNDIGEDEGLPKFLRESYRKGHGIVILSEYKPEYPKSMVKRRGAWVKSSQDDRKEDMSIIAGPVILKGESKEPEMVSILYVNSRDSKAFSTRHVDYMKCCTDILSIIYCSWYVFSPPQEATDR